VERREKEKCMMQFAQSVANQHRFPLSHNKEGRFIVESVIDQEEDFKLSHN
jgi:hypothetical protein